MQGPDKPNTSSYGRQSSAQSSSQGTVDQLKHKAGDAAEQAKHVASDVVDQVQDKASQVVDQAQQAVTPRLEGQKQQLSGTLDSTARALRQTSSQLRDGEVPAVANVLDQGVQQIEKLSGFLESHTIGEIVEETEQFARRQPTLFIAGALALGFIGARFLKSSRRNTIGSGYSGNSYNQYRTSMPASTPGSMRSTTPGMPSSYPSAASSNRPEYPSTPSSARPSTPSSNPSTSGVHNTSPIPPITGNGGTYRENAPGSQA